MNTVIDNAIGIIMSILATGILGLIKMYYQGLEFQKELGYIKDSLVNIKAKQETFTNLFHAQDLINERSEEAISIISKDVERLTNKPRISNK